MELTKIEMSGNEYQVDVSADGRFAIRNDAGDLLGSGKTLEAAKQRARTEIAKAKVKVSVPFLTRNGEQGVATSRNARTHNVLATINGRREQIEKTWHFRSYFKPDTPREVLERLKAIQKESNKLDSEQRTLEEEWSMDVGRAVDEAVEQAGREAAGVSA